MRKNLEKIATRLSETEIRQLLTLKKRGGKLSSLAKKRAKLAASLEKLDQQLARLQDGGAAKPARRKRGSKGLKSSRTGKPARNQPAAAEKKAAKKAAAPRTYARRGGRGPGLTAAVREILGKAGGETLNAEQVVDALPGAGIKVLDVKHMRKRVSIVLASQGKYFEQVKRGLYRIRGG